MLLRRIENIKTRRGFFQEMNYVDFTDFFTTEEEDLFYKMHKDLYNTDWYDLGYRTAYHFFKEPFWNKHKTILLRIFELLHGESEEYKIIAVDTKNVKYTVYEDKDQVFCQIKRFDKRNNILSLFWI